MKPFLSVILGLAMAATGLRAQSDSLASPEPTSSAVLSLPGENLIPAAIGVRTDRKGNSWNVERNGVLGRVGSTMVNSGLVLSVNQQNFETFQPRMTRDGKEFVIHGRSMPGLAGIQVVRRIRFNEEKGSLRYLELFFNGSASPVTLSVELATSFSGNYKTSVTDRANIDPVMLSEGETGILVTPGSSQSNRAFLFVLCGPEAPDKPTISTQSRYGLKFQYQLTLNPGETKGLAHVVAQTIVPSQFDRKTLSRLFDAYSLEEARRTIPDPFQDTIANRSVRQSRSGLLLGGDTIESLGVDRADTDVLAIGEQTRLFGKANFGPLEIDTGFGNATIPVDNVSAIAGKNRGLRDQVRVFLKDGQIISGEIPAGEITFAMKSGGQMKLSMEKLDRLVIAKHPPVPHRAGEAMIQTWAGDQLKWKGNDNLLFFGLTPWGELSFSLADLSWLIPAPDDFPGYQVKLKNGTECLVYLSGRDLIVNTGYVGELTLNLNSVRAILPAVTGGNTNTGTRIRLTADQWINGTIREKEIDLISGGQPVTLKTGEIRRLSSMRYGSEDPVNHPFLAEMWDGGRIEGFLRVDQLNFDVQGQEWVIPPIDILEIETAGPTLNRENRVKVAELVTKLGDENWEIREQATRELPEFGYHAIPMLRRELNLNPDPEVRRRIERVLNTFKNN
ncbi:MAG: HEAT repeat domain-containing protein [Verrucomicrobiales bacterium]|nr:HEAT repeat domain-containing protein [Verrucomicrobiales bacterium]